MHVGFVVTQPLNIFQANASGEDVIGKGQHVIGFPARHMALQQQDIFVDGPVQLQLAHQFVQGADSAGTVGPGPFGDLIVNVGVLEHGIGLVLWDENGYPMVKQSIPQ
jgi:hypothetical protein